PDEWSHNTFFSDDVKTTIFHNWCLITFINYYNSRWDQLHNNTLVSTGHIRNIGGASGNNMPSLINGFFILDRATYSGQMAFFGRRYANTLP
ncbi:hypothetical protein LPJ59_005648, partial [Coemansia sp. RSA 2399]